MSTRVPECGEAIRLRSRTYLVEAVEPDPGGSGTLVEAPCLDDDAQGQQLEVVWELERGTEILRWRVKDVVVAGPPSMLDQWKEELETRFGLTFEVTNREYIERVRQQRGSGVNPWTTFPRFLVSQRLLVDESYVGPMRYWLGSLRPAALLILDEAHHAAPSSGARYAIDSRITRAIREIAPKFEHRLFLSATPHNGHSNSFSALLELLDPQRFTRGVKVLKGQLDAVMVRRLNVLALWRNVRSSLSCGKNWSAC